MKKYDTLVYIGRFQPFHNGHLEVVRQALELAEHVVILVGSSYSSRNPRNPWTFVERSVMIDVSLGEAFPDLQGHWTLAPIRDYPYNDQAWITSVQRTVAGHTRQEDKIGIIGFNKDATSDYLKWFPAWTTEILPVQFSTLNSSNIRKGYFDPYFRLPGTEHCPKAVCDILLSFTADPTFKWLVDYVAKDNADLKQFGPGPALCSDALVEQSGYILLVERKNHPGKGQLALPGGHLDPGETLKNCAVRELREETDIQDGYGRIPKGKLSSFILPNKTKVYDNPERSTGPRKITQLFHFKLPDAKELYHVVGQDDAERATWVPLGSLRASDLFHDHAAIIMDQLGIIMKD